MRIDQALESMTAPCCAPPYHGKADKFITFQFVLDSAEYISEGVTRKTKRQWGVDLFTKSDWSTDIETIKNLLIVNGFSVTDCGPEIYESDTGYYHIPLSCYEVV